MQPTDFNNSLSQPIEEQLPIREEMQSVQPSIMQRTKEVSDRVNNLVQDFFKHVPGVNKEIISVSHFPAQTKKEKPFSELSTLQKFITQVKFWALKLSNRELPALLLLQKNNVVHKINEAYGTPTELKNALTTVQTLLDSYNDQIHRLQNLKQIRPLKSKENNELNALLQQKAEFETFKDKIKNQIDLLMLNLLFSETDIENQLKIARFKDELNTLQELVSTYNDEILQKRDDSETILSKIKSKLDKLSKGELLEKSEIEKQLKISYLLLDMSNYSEERIAVDYQPVNLNAISQNNLIDHYSDYFTTKDLLTTIVAILEDENASDETKTKMLDFFSEWLRNRFFELHPEELKKDLKVGDLVIHILKLGETQKYDETKLEELRTVALGAMKGELKEAFTGVDVIREKQIALDELERKYVSLRKKRCLFIRRWGTRFMIN